MRNACRRGWGVGWAEPNYHHLAELASPPHNGQQFPPNSSPHNSMQINLINWHFESCRKLYRCIWIMYQTSVQGLGSVRHKWESCPNRDSRKCIAFLQDSMMMRSFDSPTKRLAKEGKLCLNAKTWKNFSSVDCLFIIASFNLPQIRAWPWIELFTEP